MTTTQTPEKKAYVSPTLEKRRELVAITSGPSVSEIVEM